MIKDIGLITSLFKAKPAQQKGAKPSRLSFSLDTPAGGDKIAEIMAGMERRVSKLGNAYSYSIGSQGMDATEKMMMEQAKSIVIEQLSSGDLHEKGTLFQRAKEISANAMSGRITPEKAAELSYLVAHDTVGCGPITVLAEDTANIEEIEINSPGLPITVYLQGYGRCATNIRFNDERSFRYCINKFILENEKELNEETPIIDAQVGDARVHAQIRPYALSGAAASIRLGKGRSMGLYRLIESGTVGPDLLAYLWMALDSKMNIVISGAPASGKTTLLGALGNFIPPYSRLLTIEEEINELRFNMPMFNIVSLRGSRYGATNTRIQVINALRMRPDRLIIGEIRGEEAKELFSGANIGIPFMTTMHSGEESLAVIKKLLVKPMAVEPRSLSMLDLSIYMRQSGIRSRILSSMTEYKWLSRAETESGVEVGDGDSVETLTTAADGRTSEEVVGHSKALSMYSKFSGISRSGAMREFRRRSSFLEKTFSKSKKDDEIADAVSKYRSGAFA